MKKRILDYLQLSLQGTGIASLGTLSIVEPKFETVLFGSMRLGDWLAYSHFEQRELDMSPMTLAFIFMASLGIGGILYAIYGK